MSEYWKSTPKYWCKHCKTYIRDTPFERTQHEATGKHQGNLKRFLRDLHRNHERDERESQRAKSEVERLTNLVSGGGPSKTGEASDRSKQRQQGTGSASNQQKPISVEERKKQMAQLVELGVAIPEEYRRDMALAGDWQTIAERTIETEPIDDKESAALNIGVRKKRKLEGEDDSDEPGGEVGASDSAASLRAFRNNNWGSSTRHYPGAAEDGDLDALLATTKNIMRKHPNPKSIGAEEEYQSARDDVKAEEDIGSSKERDADPIKAEDPLTAGLLATEEAKSSDAGSGIIFKKRKTKTMKKI